MAANQVYIYGLYEPGTMIIRYVGMTNNPLRRFREHLKPYLQRKSNSHLYNWINVLGKKNQKPEMRILQEVPVEEWEEAEKKTIKKEREQGSNLVNTSEGGEGNQGYKPTAKNRRNMSEGQKGNTKRKGTKTSAEGIENMRSARAKQSRENNVWISQEFRDKMSKITKGQKRKKPCKRTIRKRARSHQRFRFSFKDPSGEVVMVRYFSDFCRKYNLDRSHMLRMATKTNYSHKGWTFVKKTKIRKAA